jgi:hypothetical protein
MARLSPEQQIKRILRAIQGWEKEAPGSTFSRRTLAQFKAAMQPSLDAHERVVGLRGQLRVAIEERNGLVGKAVQTVSMTGSAVQGDPAYGRDSTLNEAFGNTRESVRRARIRRAMRRRRAKRKAHGDG